MSSLVTYKKDTLKWQQIIKASPLILGGKSHWQVFKKLSHLCSVFLMINNFDTDVKGKQPTAFKLRKEKYFRAHMCMDKVSQSILEQSKQVP